MSSRTRIGLPRAGAVSPFTPVCPPVCTLHRLGTIARVCAMVAAAALPAGAWAADAELGEVTVRGTTDPQTLPTVAPGGQVAKGAGLGVLGQRDVMDTPFNITSYTAEGIANQNAATLMSVLENDPSVRFTTNTGHAYENFTIRGLGVNASELGFNGLYGLAPDGHVPVEMIERVEVLKGPGALMSGMTPGGAVGGTINLVTKRPLARDLTRVTTMFSSGSQLGLQADVSRRFGPERRLGIRVNGSTSSGDTEIDGQNRRHGLGALALDYQGDGFTLGLDAYSYRSTIRDGSPMMVSMQNLKQVIAAPDATTNLFPGIHAKQQSDALMLRGSVDLGADWTLFGSAGTAQHAYDGMLNGTRVVLRAQGDGSAVGQTYNQYGYTDSTAAEFGVRGRLRTGGVNHLLVASLNWMNQKGGRAAVATSASYITNIYDPAPITLAGPYGAIKQERDDVLSSLALADTLSWGGDAVQLTVGARLQRVNQKMAGYNEQAVSPALGLVVKPWGDAVSLYANHVQGLSAGSIVGATYANAGEVFAPYKTKQFEIGAKWRTGDFTQTVSLFQIERPSSVVETATNRLLMDGEQRNRGLEWNVFGEPLRGTRVLGGLAYTQAIQSKTQGGARDGFGVYGVPRWTANLGGEWDVPALPGATLTGRLIYTGAQWVNSANTLKMPSWTRVDVGARYATRIAAKPVTFRATVENLFDKSYWAGSFNDNFATTGGPRTVRVSATVDF